MNTTNSTVAASHFEVRGEGAEARLHVTLGKSEPLVYSSRDEAYADSRVISDGSFALWRVNGEKDAEEARRTGYEAEEEIARNTRCAFDGCNGDTHEGRIDPAEWMHCVFRDKFDNWEVQIVTEDGHYVANLYIDAEGDMTSQEMRVDADLYESFPAWLRMIAEKVDGLNATK